MIHFDFVGNNGIGNSMDLMNVITSKIEEVRKHVTQEKTALAAPAPPNPFVNPHGVIKTVAQASTNIFG